MRPQGRRGLRSGPLSWTSVEYRSVQHEGHLMKRTGERAGARARALEWAERLTTRVLQA